MITTKNGNGSSNGASHKPFQNLTLAQGNLSADRRDRERAEQAKAQVEAQRAQSDDGDLRAELARLRAENEALKASSQKVKVQRVFMKVTEKGGASLYGLGRFPVTLYKSQWVKLLEHVEDIRAFLLAHDGQLSTKD